jgi:hypothetical protein
MLWIKEDCWALKKVIVIHDEGQWMTFSKKDVFAKR